MKSVSAFALTVEKGNFTNAAKELDITPSMLSRQIRELEAYLDCKLINRTTRKQGLTAAGECYYRYCTQLLATAEQAKKAVHQLNDSVVGHLRLSAPIAYGNRILAPIVADFIKQYPAVSIEMNLSDHRVDLVEDNYQIAIRIGDVVDEGVVALPLPPYRMLLAASPEYLESHPIPENPQDLLQHNCISFSQWRSNKYWTLKNANETHQLEITPTLLCNTGESIRQAALSGAGIVLNSEVMLDRDIQTGRLIQILPNFTIASHTMHILRCQTTPVPPVIDMFIKHVLKAV
ncbi:LysR family transcriptional regulator [Vibrio eleionomae]|nr:LysR family transcriptional regulator [Vibrio eleionomae]